MRCIPINTMQMVIMVKSSGALRMQIFIQGEFGENSDLKKNNICILYLKRIERKLCSI